MKFSAHKYSPVLCALLLLVGCKGAVPSNKTADRVIEDSAGRQIGVPTSINRVLAAGSPAAVFVYTLAPEMLVGWPRSPLPEAGRFLPAEFMALPELGRLNSRGGSANLEVVLRAEPDLILDYGTLSPSYVSLADRVQKQTGIPYVILDGSFEGIPAAYRKLGEILGLEQRAEELATYAEGVIGDMRAAREKARGNGPSVYLARGSDGLETGRSSALNAELFGFVGARNVAGGGKGLAKISLENLLYWDPTHIVTIDGTTRDRVVGDERWAALAAVREDRVHLAPCLPFGWIDRPPSVNRLMGVRWLMGIFYPGSVADLSKEVATFYRLFYRYELNARELSELLASREVQR